MNDGMEVDGMEKFDKGKINFASDEKSSHRGLWQESVSLKFSSHSANIPINERRPSNHNEI